MTPSSGGRGGMATTREGTKKAGGDFNANGTQLLPNLGQNDTQKGINNSFIDFRNDKPQGNQTTSEILYLKRLLFLKASLDNENTVNSLQVPLSEDRAFTAPQGN